jgi:hypothetical protein
MRLFLGDRAVGADFVDLLVHLRDDEVHLRAHLVRLVGRDVLLLDVLLELRAHLLLALCDVRAEVRRGHRELLVGLRAVLGPGGLVRLRERGDSDDGEGESDGERGDARHGVWFLLECESESFRPRRYNQIYAPVFATLLPPTLLHASERLPKRAGNPADLRVVSAP